ncbi:hypothetical protein MRX96_047465 [Rhipicephalus microplus]
MEVTVEGTEITPEEFRTADWITKVGKHVKELRDAARGDRQGRQDGNARAESGTEPGEDRKKTAAANAAYKKAGAQDRGALDCVVPTAVAGERLQDNHLSEVRAGAHKNSEHQAQ